MEPWSAHQLFNSAVDAVGLLNARSLQRYSQALQDRGLPVVFTLRHLAMLCDVPYRVLHDTVNRKRESCNYRMYSIKKRSGGRRFIHSVTPVLQKVQRFVNEMILQKCSPHPASFAFHPTGGIGVCAQRHCRARWLFQFDLTDFFYDVTETDVFQVFCSLGYRRLLAFELARLCTTTRLPKFQKRRAHCTDDRLTIEYGFAARHSTLRLPYALRRDSVGVLPQGAPSSPMLSNLAAYHLDERLDQYAKRTGMVYTRYADDLSFSATALPLERAVIRRDIVALIRECGFLENSAKTRISGPGSRKRVLGLLVDGDVPRLSHDMYKRIDRLIYSVGKFGIQEVANHFGFESAYGLHNHLGGLISFVKSVDRVRWEEFTRRLETIMTDF